MYIPVWWAQIHQTLCIYRFGGPKFTKRYVYTGLVGPNPPNAMYVTVWWAQIHQTLCIHRFGGPKITKRYV